MSQKHVDEILRLMDGGTLADLELSEEEVLGVSDEWEFVPDEDYDPFCELPPELKLGVQKDGEDTMWIIGTTGMAGHSTWVGFKLRSAKHG